MTAPEIVVRLVEKFTQNREAYRSGKYNEAQLRLEFIDPFFEALGWDVYNKKGYAPDYRDVVIEESLEIEGASKAPDYSFRIGGVRKFFVEAKKPKVDIAYDIHPAYQLRRYAWNAHLPLSILTDFEELAVYNCTNKPNPSDSAATGRDRLYKFNQYIEKWDEIAGIFSPEAILKGSFDQFAATSKGKKGTTEVDDAILADIEEWRKALAQNIALRNSSITDERQINYAVQMTIDRILFLRICEDRGIEPDEQIKELCATADIYPRLVELFKRADRKYNSGLFHFEKENDQTSAADTFTPSLSIDDKVLKEIVKDIYYPCPYIFKEIPVEILGQVYERFLGKVIHLTQGHQVRIEEKPEVRKAGGVYYTPQYIVDYIVANTVGKLLEGKTPEQAAALKIVDPACGSGSFLLGAYQYLLDWHERWYEEHDAEKWARGKDAPLMPSALALTGGSARGYRLTTQKRKEILVNNIHGVDIDPQAVEVTKLSLLLKVLEMESGQLTLGFERALPDLGRNIQCGNSLIGDDYFEGQLVVDEDERRRVNPFDWQAAFPQVFAKGGFDAVIGNPPYVRQESLGNDKNYFQKYYQVYFGTADLYSYFIEKGISLLASKGYFCYIVANKWLRANYGESLRKWLQKRCIEEIIDFGDLRVFENATAYPCIIRIANESPHYRPEITQVKTLSFPDLSEYINRNKVVLDQNSFSDSGWSLANDKIQRISEKIQKNSISLRDYVNGSIFRGIITGLNEAFVIDSSTYNSMINSDKKNQQIVKPFVIGRDVKRYKTVDAKQYLILFPKGWTRKASADSKNPFQWMTNNYPNIFLHLKKFIKDAEKRGDKGDYWWELRACENYGEFEKPKIVYPNICGKPEFTYDTTGFYTNQKCYIIPKNDFYLLGILNSKIMMFFFETKIPKLRGGFFEPSFVFMKDFPVRKIDVSNTTDVKKHDQMVALVTRMLELHKRTPATPQESEHVARDIASTDRQIDRLVYELYGLTEEEIKIVEGN